VNGFPINGYPLVRSDINGNPYIRRLEIYMTYAELIAKALNGRSVNSMAKQWGLAQTTLQDHVTGKSIPDFCTARLMALEAGVDAAEVFNILADEVAKRKNRSEKIRTVVGKLQPSFNTLLRIANAFWMRVQGVAQ